MRRVVITGVGVVSPIGTGLGAFEEGLATARSGIDLISSFDASSFATRIAGEVKDDLLASPLLASLPEALAPALRRDRKAIFVLHAGRQALQQAFGGAPPPCPPQRRGVMVSAGLEIFHLQDLLAHLVGGQLAGDRLLQEVLAAPASAHLQIPAHLGPLCLARELGAEGIFSVNLSACAAGTQAIGEAFRAVREGRLDLVVTGGCDSMVNPLGIAGFSRLEALSRSNELGAAASRPFDRRRDGFVLGEGAAILVLESEAGARARGAEPLGELLGYASSLDAFRVTDPAPDVAGAVAAMSGALREAGLPAAALDYINAHGTGTRKNDPAETTAIRRVCGAAANRIPVSSTKSQIGHCIGAAGAVELLAALFAIRRGLLPATINLTDPDPECDLDYVPCQPRPARVRTALSSSFGFGGQNAAVVVGAVR